MKHLIKILLAISLMLPAVFLIVVYGSCRKDKCKGVSCLNGGVCHSGSCTCATGYEGANCGVPWRNKFLGVWPQTGNSLGKTTQFSLTISADTSGITKVLISNFDNTLSQPLKAYVTSSDSLVIPQLPTDSSVVEGAAIYAGSSDIGVYYEIYNITSNIIDTVTTKW